MYRIVFLVVSSLLLWGCKEQNNKKIALPYYNEPTFTPIFEKNENLIDKNITHKISDFSFLNQDSVLISQKEIEGKIHVASFIFTSCGSICPTMTSNLKTVSDKFEKNTDIVLLSYSVTPWIDKPNVLKKFKNKYEISNKNWHFLTGSKADIYRLARQSYFAEEDIGFTKDSTEFLHTEHIILVDKTKRIRGVYNGTLSLEMQNLITDIETLTEEEK
ncbi:MAG: SCO family protein [Sphingobacteriaceae bacterium]|nr:SCO family protein [Sphingobacteriaceae bacterium]